MYVHRERDDLLASLGLSSSSATKPIFRPGGAGTSASGKVKLTERELRIKKEQGQGPRVKRRRVMEPTRRSGRVAAMVDTTADSEGGGKRGRPDYS